MKSIAIIGDIHGCLGQLKKLYEKILKYTDDVYSVGDLIDRGEHIKEVVQFCVENKIKPVMGNHEYMMLSSISMENNFADRETYYMWMQIGGGMAIRDYCKSGEETLQNFTEELKNIGHYDFLKSLPIKAETETCIITHAGIVTGKPESNALFNRGMPSKLKKLQIFGHTPSTKAIYEKGHFVNIDSGCIYWGRLSAAVVNSDGSCEIISAEI
jgi:hypothetical protein